jgi:hypothetical protein
MRRGSSTLEGNLIEGFRIRSLDCSSGEIGDEAGAEKNGEDAEVLSCVFNTEMCVTAPEGVLDSGT